MNADKFVVRGQTYDVLSPATFGDYLETIGAACINPDGYAENKLFLAYDDNVQKLFRATAAIAYSDLLIKNTNCEPTTMAEALANALSAGGVSYDNSDSGLTASNAQGAIDEVNGKVETVKSDLANLDTVISENGAKNLLPVTKSNVVRDGITVSINTDPTSPNYGAVTLSGTATGGTFQFDMYGTSGHRLFDDGILPTGVSYKISGTPSGVDTTKVYMMLATSAGTATDTGIGATIDVPLGATGGNLAIYVAEGTTVNCTFKPMITLASQPNSDYAHYVPYAKTNRELTEVKSYTIEASTYANAFNFRKVGNVVQVQLPAVKNNIPVASLVTVGNLPSDLIPLFNSVFQSEDPETGSNAIRYQFTSQGALQMYRYSGTVGTGTLMNVGGTGCYLTK